MLGDGVLGTYGIAFLFIRDQCRVVNLDDSIARAVDVGERLGAGVTLAHIVDVP